MLNFLFLRNIKMPIEENKTNKNSSTVKKEMKNDESNKKKLDKKNHSDSILNSQTKEKEKDDSLKTLTDTSNISTDSVFAEDSIYTDSTLVTVDTLYKSSTDTIPTTTLPPFMSGNEPQSRTNHPGHDSGIIIILSITFLLVAFNYSSYRRLLSTYSQSLWNVRRRANAFDDHTTNERSLIAILIFQLCVYVGILLSAKISTIIPINPDKILITTYSMMGVYGLYYLFQLTSYSIVGWVFSDDGGLSQWIKGFNASHIFLGFALIIPTLISIFYPTTTEVMLTIAIILYVIVRLMFIFKGFRIFYNNLYSLFYFILYLCTLEIIPIFFVYGIAQKIFDSLQ